MKPLKKSIVTGILLTMLFSLLFTVSFAQKENPNRASEREMREPMPPHPPDPPGHPGRPVMDDDDMTPPALLDLPKLTEEQKEKIKQARIENTKAITPLRNQAREKKARLQTILTTMPVDLKAADQVADELGKLGTDLMKQMIRHDQDIRGILTPEQQVLYDARPKPFLRRTK